MTSPQFESLVQTLSLASTATLKIYEDLESDPVTPFEHPSQVKIINLAVWELCTRLKGDTKFRQGLWAKLDNRQIIQKFIPFFKAVIVNRVAISNLEEKDIPNNAFLVEPVVIEGSQETWCVFQNLQTILLREVETAA